MKGPTMPKAKPWLAHDEHFIQVGKTKHNVFVVSGQNIDSGKLNMDQYGKALAIGIAVLLHQGQIKLEDIKA